MRGRTNILLSLLLSICWLQPLLAATAGDKTYPAAAIPEALQKGADAVVRNEKTVFKIVNAGKALEIRELVITILNPRGDEYAEMALGYDKLSKIKAFEGALYDAEGKLLTKLKKSDITDGSAYSGSFVEDNRFKAAGFTHRQYPYTVIWYTERETGNTMFYPTWLPPVDEKVSVEHASLEMVCPAGFEFRHRTYGLEAPLRQTDKDGSQVTRWQVSNLPARELEPMFPYWQGTQGVITSPISFEIDGRQGNMQTWQAYGSFMYALNQGRDQLPQEVVSQVKSLTAPFSSARDKAKAVYEYMQQNTRYVSIQLGIGGWQPFEASFVNEKGYGDCKALSNYTMALLKAAGVPSYYTLISAGAESKDEVLADFPKSYFNHVILCVPLEKDTVWLECTSQTSPFGHLGSFTGNRKALLITAEGGKLVNTRFYGADDNVQSTKTVIDLKEGAPSYKLFRTYKGILFDTPYDVMRADQQQQKKWLYQRTGMPEVSVKHYQLNKTGTAGNISMQLHAEGALLQKQQIAGNRMFIPLGINKFPLEMAKPVAARKTDFVLEWAYTFSDTLIYKVPAQYKPEHLPPPQRIQTDFGSYTLEVSFESGEIVCLEKFMIKQGRYPAARYAEWVAFVKQMHAAHAGKAVMVQSP